MDRLERDMQGRLRVLRFGVGNRVGQQLAARYGVTGVPTFVLLDGSGVLAHYQIGRLDADLIKTQVAGLE